MKKYVKNAVKSALSKPLRGRYRRLLSIGVSALLAVSTFLAAIPQTETIVYADSDKTITGLCTGAIGNPTSGAGGWSYVYYGTYSGNAMKYRVLDKAATQFNTNTTMLLDCDSTLINKAHDSQSPYHYGENGWTNSEINTWLNGNEFYGNTNVFTAREKAAIASSTKNPAAEGDGHGCAGIGYAQLTGEHVFLLDAVEATRQSYGYADQATAHDTRRKNGTSNFWWLRSPNSSYDDSAGRVSTSGDIYDDYVSIGIIGVSPAFNLNLESVIFSSLIPNKTNEYKLTVKDTNMTIAKTDGSDVTRAGNVVTVPYTISGTNSGNATQVSVLITDDEYSSGTVATTGYSYQKLNVTTWGTSGTGTFTLPAAYADESCGTDYYAYILAEDVNDGTATDYASVPASITIPDLPQVATPTFSPAAGTYTETQNVTISCTTTEATIHYTTDGTTPTTSSQTYSSAINVDGNMTIKAIAVKSGMTNSEIASATYTISDERVAVTGVSVSPKEIELKPGASKKLTHTITPDNATNKNVRWSTSKESVATVDNDGKVTAVDEGEAIIYVNTVDGDFSDTCRVIVRNGSPVIEECTVTYDPNGGKGDMAPQKADKGETVQLKANAFTRNGYNFTKWNTKPDGSGESYDDKQSVKLEKDMTLYAQWAEDKPVPPVEEEYTVTVTVSSEKTGTAKASVKSGKTGTKVTLKAVSKAGYKFKKWKVVSGSVDLADATKTKTTFAIKDANVKVKAIFEKIYEAPQPEIEPVGDDGIILAWWKVNEAEGYDIFMSRCNHGGKEISPKLVKTIEGNKTFEWTATGLKPNKSYKAYIKAYVTDKNGKKKYISKSPLMHVYTAGGNRTYTNAKSVKINTSDGKIKKGKLTLKVKDTYKIKASVKKADKKKKLLPDSHVKTLRYRSSDPGVATVGSSGKITAKKKGKCKVYVYAHNGVNKIIKVTVK